MAFKRGLVVATNVGSPAFQNNTNNNCVSMYFISLQVGQTTSQIAKDVFNHLHMATVWTTKDCNVELIGLYGRKSNERRDSKRPLGKVCEQLVDTPILEAQGALSRYKEATVALCISAKR